MKKPVLKILEWVFIVVFLLIVIGIGIGYRNDTNDLPITDGWAENSVYDFYRAQVAGQVEEQYPNLPTYQKNSLVEQELDNFLIENEEMVEQQITTSSAPDNSADITYPHTRFTMSEEIVLLLEMISRTILSSTML